MTPRSVLAIGSAILLLAEAAAGDPVKHADAISRVVEMPAHKALQRVISKPETTLSPFTTDGCSGGLSGAWSLVADQFPGYESIHEAATIAIENEPTVSIKWGMLHALMSSP